jgi:peptide-methionine (S)-S-oxide reductase
MTEIATLGGGCFWCVEAFFQDLKGVLRVESGYSGGKEENPTYKEICSGLTGHAEVIQVHYDPSIIDYADILEIFFTVHDPTTFNRQGNDIGTQYRSAIFLLSDEQREMAEAGISKAAGDWPAPIVTTIEGPATWYPAEDYHQEYWDGEGQRNSYCLAVIPPKLAKLKKGFAQRLANSA